MSNEMRNILVTGASRGIGRAIASRLADRKRTLYIHGRDKKALGETGHAVSEAGAEAVALTAELSHAAGVEELVAGLKDKPIDILVNNAGIAVVKEVGELTPEDWQATLNVNVTAPFLLVTRLLPQMSEGSAIVNIMSMAAHIGIPNWSSYCMSKFAMEGFSQALRAELRPRGIRVINVYPSATNTPLWDRVGGDFPRDKMLDPTEVAEAVAYAVSRPGSVLVENINVGNIAGTL